MYQAENYVFAESTRQAAELLRQDAKNAVLAGGMWMRTLNGKYHTLIDLSRLGLDSIRDCGSYVELGAMTTLRQAETSALLHELYGDVFSSALSYIVGVQFRNMATVGGSVFGKYAFSDLIAVLLALDAQVVFENLGVMALEVYLADGKERDLLVAVRIPKPGFRAAYQTHRLSKTDFGVLNVCVSCRESSSYRVVVGSRPARPVRCTEAETLLDQGDLEGAKQAVQKMTYADCIRGSGEYRRVISKVLLERAYLALQNNQEVEG